MTSTPDPAQGAETPEAADPTGPATGAPAQAVEIIEASEALSGGELLSRTAAIGGLADPAPPPQPARVGNLS